MLDRLRSIWYAPDLRKKIFITLGILVIYRFIAYIPVPGIDPKTVQSAFAKNPNFSQIFGLLSVFSGGSIQNFSIVALGVYPYITASIVIQLLQPIIPALDKMSREEGESGKNKLSQITRYISVPLAFLQGFGQLTLFVSLGAITAGTFNLLNGSTFVASLTSLVVLTTGVMTLVWLGEIITENGIGNGISLIIFTNIVAGLPQGFSQFFLSKGVGSSTNTSNSSQAFFQFLFFLVVAFLLIMLIVFVTLADRRIPVQYPNKQIMGGRRIMESRQTSYIPIKLNQGGMVPLIFAQSLLLFPVILASYIAVPTNPITWLRDLFTNLRTWLDPSGTIYPIAFFLLVIGFTYFYAVVLFEQMQLGESLRKQGAFVSGVRPGDATESYLQRILSRVTLWGALFLAVIAIVPYLIPGFRLGGQAGASSAGGLLTAASLIIIVQVAIDTVKQVQSQLVMKNYSGFLR